MSLFLELRRILRATVARPAPAVAAVLTLALGIGASTAVFSVVYGVLLRSLPYPDASRIVQVWQVGETGNEGTFSEPNFQDLRERAGSFGSLARYNSWLASVSGDVAPVRVRRAVVSREFFDVLRVDAAPGRIFTEEELRVGAEPVALVSHGFWQRHLGARDLPSTRLRLDGALYRVVGVLPPGFSFPADTDLWVPAEAVPPIASRTAHNWYVLGRLADGVPLERARAEASTLARELREIHGEDTWMVDASVVPLQEELVGETRPALLVLLAAVGFLLLVAAANVVNILLARALAREREIALSAALGAGRWALLRPFLLESLVLALFGGALGVALAFASVRTLLALEPGSLPRSSEIGVHLPVLGFAAALSFVTAVGLGLLAGRRATRVAGRRSLHEAQRFQTGGGGGLRRGLVVSQVALTLVLLVGAGLLARSLFRLLAVDPGFRRSGTVVMELSFPLPSSVEERRELARVHERILDAIRSLGGVAGAGSVDRLPMAQSFRSGMFLKPGENDVIETYEDYGRLAEDPSRVGFAEYRAASAGFFEVMGIPLVRGRLFEESDDAGAPHVALVSESLVASAWPGEDPLGKLIEFGNMDGDLRVMRVVGVVGEVRHGGLDSQARATIYTNAEQRPPYSFSVVVDAAAAEAALVPELRRVVRELAPDVPPRFRTIEQVISTSLASRRFSLVLAGVFGAAALGLAVMGIYGVVSYGVSQRTPEIGIRVALGASPGDVLRSIASQGLRLIAAGLALGLGASFVLTRLLAGLLFGVSPNDPATFVGLSLLLGVLALAGCLAPALRAARLDARTALQSD